MERCFPVVGVSLASIWLTLALLLITTNSYSFINLTGQYREWRNFQRTSVNPLPRAISDAAQWAKRTRHLHVEQRCPRLEENMFFCLFGRITTSSLLEKTQKRPKADLGPKTDSSWCEVGILFKWPWSLGITSRTLAHPDRDPTSTLETVTYCKPNDLSLQSDFCYFVSPPKKPNTMTNRIISFMEAFVKRSLRRTENMLSPENWGYLPEDWGTRKWLWLYFTVHLLDKYKEPKEPKDKGSTKKETHKWATQSHQPLSFPFYLT